MKRGFVRQQNARKHTRASVKSGRILRHAMVIGAVDKKAYHNGGERGANESFFSDRRWSSNNRGLHSFRTMEEEDAREREKKERKARSLARSRSYGGNFQASGFPGNLWRGHSLDRHEQCSPSFIRPCYRSRPFGPAGVTRVIRERCIHARERTWLVRWDITSLTRADNGLVFQSVCLLQ